MGDNVRSQRIVGPVVVAASAATTVYTVPVGRTLVVRQMVVVNQSSTLAGSFHILLNGTSSSNNGLWKGVTLAAGARFTDAGWYAFNPGDFLRVSNGATPVNFFLFGSLLDGAPS